MARARRDFSGVQSPVERRAQLLAWGEVETALRERAIRCYIAAHKDGGGLALDVAVPADFIEAAREWQAGFGKSFGPVRINLHAEP